MRLSTLLAYGTSLTIAIAGLAGLTLSARDAGNHPAGAEWPRHDGDASGSRFSTLTQITPENVAKLQVAWTFDTGTPGIQYQLPLLLDAANQGLTTVERAVALACTKPAEIFGLDHKGRLAPGCDADIVIADVGASWEITDDGVLSRCGWTPYAGRTCSAQIVRTMVRGVDVWNDGKVTGRPGHGIHATPTTAGG